VAHPKAPLAVMLWRAGPQCDSPEAIATVKSLAVQKIFSLSSLDVLLKSGGSSADREFIRKQVHLRGDPAELTFDSFRERGSEGKGVRCAAMAYVLVGTKRTFEFSAEYSVEPTTDGKTIVSARFMPN